MPPRKEGPFRIALFHGYELQGSGSNEYSRYLSRALGFAGHEVHMLCREEKSHLVPHVSRALQWNTEGVSTELFSRSVPAEEGGSAGGSVTVHVLPHASIRPVYVCDKQRAGNVKAFSDLSDDELKEYHELNVKVVAAVLDATNVDILWANHVVYQPIIAMHVCPPRKIPFIIFPHGSAIEYTVRGNLKFLQLVRTSIEKCAQLVTGSREVRDRILAFFPDMKESILAKFQLVGVGVDTSLFQPVARMDREKTIAEMINAWEKQRQAAGIADSEDPMLVGKTPALREELFSRLDKGGSEIEAAVQAYRKAGYDHNQTDADLPAQLRSLNWNAPTMLFVGALTAGKGVQSLLMALPRIWKHVPDAQLVIVGAGAYREGLEAFQHALATGNKGLLMRLANDGYALDQTHMKGSFSDIEAFLQDDAAAEEALAVGNRILEKVKFLGRINHDLLKFLFPCFDVATFPSVVPEAYPLVLMECLSNGVLPLVSNFSGFKDGLDELVPWLGADYVDLLRIPNESETRVAEIARKLTATLQNPNLTTLGPQLRAIAVEHFDWNKRAEQVTTAIAKTLHMSNETN